MRSRVRHLLLLLVSAAAALFGQIGQMGEIVAPSVRVTAGNSMTLSGFLAGNDGAIRAQDPVWKVDQPSIATIDSSGKLTGVSLGVVKVTATWDNASHDILIQVTPDHVTISPPSANLLIGDQVQFTASAFDTKGNRLPNVNFTWAITSNTDDNTPYVHFGNISTSGMLTGAFEGSAFVRALYTYTSPTGGVEAGMDPRIPLYAPIVVSAPRPFKLKRLFNATEQPRQNPVLRARPSLLWTAPDGRLLFNASLDGLGTALVAWDGTSFQPIVTAGTPSNAPGSIITDLGRHAISVTGDLLTQQQATDGPMVQIGTVDGLQPLLVNNIAAVGAENMSGFNTTRNSLSGGNFVFTAGYRIPGTTTSVNGLFRGAGRSVNEILFSQADTLPELGVSNINTGDFGVDRNGVAWYVANVPGKPVLFRHDGNGRQKVLTLGDALLGSTVRTLFGGRNSTPGSLFAENGDAIFGVGLNNNTNYLLRYAGADISHPAAMLRVDTLTVALAYRSDGTTLLYGNPNPNRGDGAWLWNGDSVQPVVMIGKTQVNGQPITQIESGALDASGRVTLMVATAGSPMVMIRVNPGENPQVLFQAGDAVGVQVPTLLNGFVTGGRNGNPVLFTGGANNPSLSEFRDSDAQPLVYVGSQVLGGSAFTSFNTANAVRTANGDLYAIVPGVGIGHYVGGQWDVALKFPVTLDDATAGSPYRLAVNNAGDILWLSGTLAGEQRMYLTHAGKHQLLCNNGLVSQVGAIFDGLPVFSCDDFFLDDTGRALVRVHLQNETIQRTYAWNNGAWSLAVQPNVTRLAGRTVTGVNLVRAIGARIVAVLTGDFGNVIAEWTDSGWTLLYRAVDLVSTGFQLNNITNQLELNPSGDLVMMGQAQSSIVFFQRGSSFATVLNAARRTDDGDLLVNIQGIDLREDGTIYLLALNERDEQVLYRATPIGN